MSQSISLPADIFSAACPMRRAVSLIADKWSILLLTALVQQPHHFGELQRKVDCISHKMLTQTLRKLEKDGFVRRRVIQGPVVKVQYELSPLGKSLVTPLEALWQWATTHEESLNKTPTPPAK